MISPVQWLSNLEEQDEKYKQLGCYPKRRPKT